MQPQPAASPCTDEQYIARQRAAEHKSEFLRGRASAMAGAGASCTLAVDEVYEKVDLRAPPAETPEAGSPLPRPKTLG
jgi:hypothetical protein